MTEDKLTELAAGMRVAQRRHCRTRSPMDRNRAIAVETQVDEALRDGNHSPFRVALGRLRDAQKRYHKNGSPTARNEAAQLERILDDHIATRVPDENGNLQQELF